MGKVATNLKSYREAAKLTQKELADKVGVRRETIVHLEGNKYNPSLELALQIAKVFDVSVDTIFWLTD